jgi:hypothetical protein
MRKHVPGLEIHHGGDFAFYHRNLLVRGGLALAESEERRHLGGFFLWGGGGRLLNLGFNSG